MNEERSTRLLDALEGRAETLLAMLQTERAQRQALEARIAELDARLREHNASRLELLEENRELDEQNRELEEHNRHLHERLVGNAPESEGRFPRSARRSQGLSALMGRRPPPAEPRVSADRPAPAQHEPASEAHSSEVASPERVSSEEASSGTASPGKASSETEKTAGKEQASQGTAHAQAATESPGPGQSDLPIGDAPSPQALLAEWYQRYGDAFFKGHTRPLKIGIHEELAAREPWPEKLVKRALACYVNLPRYLKAVREGAERIDLQGKPAGAVDAKAAEHARKKLDRLQSERRKPGGHKPGPAQQGKHDPASNETHKTNPGMKDAAAASASKAQARARHASASSHSPASPSASPATLEEKLSALLAKHNQQ